MGVLLEGEWSRSRRWTAQVSCWFMQGCVQMLTLELLQGKSNRLSRFAQGCIQHYCETKIKTNGQVEIEVKHCYCFPHVVVERWKSLHPSYKSTHSSAALPLNLSYTGVLDERIHAPAAG